MRSSKSFCILDNVRSDSLCHLKTLLDIIGKKITARNAPEQGKRGLHLPLGVSALGFGLLHIAESFRAALRGDITDLHPTFHTLTNP